MTRSSIRLGVDIGGTFTDVVLENEGAMHSIKVLTTYAAPENAIIDGMAQVCAKAGVNPNIGHQCVDRAARGKNRADHHKGLSRCDRNAHRKPL